MSEGCLYCSLTQEIKSKIPLPEKKSIGYFNWWRLVYRLALPPQLLSYFFALPRLAINDIPRVGKKTEQDEDSASYSCNLRRALKVDYILSS